MGTTPWGSMITAAGSALGGLFGSSGQQTMSPYKSMKSAVKFADQYGIHRLTALGANPGYQHIPGSGGGNAIAQGAAALGDSIDRNPVLKSSVRVNDAQADLLKMQTAAIAKELEATSRNGTTGARNISNPNLPTDIRADLSSARIAKSDPRFARNLPAVKDIPSAEIAAIGPKGEIHDITNPDAPMEPEQDAWRWAREGRLGTEIAKLVVKNMLPPWDPFETLNAYLKRLTPTERKRLLALRERYSKSKKARRNMRKPWEHSNGS